jgi:hypothetical protein
VFQELLRESFVTHNSADQEYLKQTNEGRKVDVMTDHRLGFLGAVEVVITMDQSTRCCTATVPHR